MEHDKNGTGSGSCGKNSEPAQTSPPARDASGSTSAPQASHTSSAPQIGNTASSASATTGQADDNNTVASTSATGERSSSKPDDAKNSEGHLRGGATGDCLCEPCGCLGYWLSRVCSC